MNVSGLIRTCPKAGRASPAPAEITLSSRCRYRVTVGIYSEYARETRERGSGGYMSMPQGGEPGSPRDTGPQAAAADQQWESAPGQGTPGSDGGGQAGPGQAGPGQQGGAQQGGSGQGGTPPPGQP